MALYFTSINSGSNGNCYYVGNKNEAVLVDVGISCKEVEKRMARLGLSMSNIKAIFISHEHGDHIKGLSVLSKKYDLPVYITDNTLRNSRLILNEDKIFNFNHLDTICIGNLKVSAFSRLHDAADPFSFTIECSDVRVGVFTDIGAVCDRLITQFKTCNAAFLEANYDTQMLESGNYPYHLKRRITSGRGHLSNHQALALFQNHKPEYMSHLLLSHLSKDNNDPTLVENLFRASAGKTFISVASRNEEGFLHYVDNKLNENKNYSFNPALYQPEQLNLFS